MRRPRVSHYPARAAARQVYRPSIDVRPWTDPVSGQKYFRATGPLQISDPGSSLLTPTDLLVLKAKVDAAVLSIGTDGALSDSDGRSA